MFIISFWLIKKHGTTTQSSSISIFCCSYVSVYLSLKESTFAEMLLLVGHVLMKMF